MLSSSKKKKKKKLSILKQKKQKNPNLIVLKLGCPSHGFFFFLSIYIMILSTHIFLHLIDKFFFLEDLIDL